MRALPLLPVLLGLSSLLLSSTREGLAQPGPGVPGGEPPDSSVARQASWVPAPGPWRSYEHLSVQDRRGVFWFLEIDRRPLGQLLTERGNIEVSSPRLRVRRQSGPDTIQVGVIVAVDNRDLALLPPGAAEESAVPSDLAEDPWGRWPNLCQISFFDTTATLDIDGNSIPEVALRRFCSCSARACSGLAFLELGLAGPRLIDPSTLVRDVHLGEVLVEDLSPSDTPGRPVLKVLPDYLEACRYLSLVGIRGKVACQTCCLFPVYLRVDDSGSYAPSYDPLVQSVVLQRTTHELNELSAVDPLHPLSAEEEGRIARVAAFFYLTGAGAETPSIVRKAFADRQRDYRFVGLLNRIDRFFRPHAATERRVSDH